MKIKTRPNNNNAATDIARHVQAEMRRGLKGKPLPHCSVESDGEKHKFTIAAHRWYEIHEEFSVCGLTREEIAENLSYALEERGDILVSISCWVK